MDSHALPASRLPEAFLDELSGAMAQLASQRRGVGFVPLANLARRLPEAASITVDYTRQRQLRAPLVVVRIADGVRNEGVWSALTPRERTVGRLLATGMTNKAIAARLGLTLATVKDHVHRILAKTGHRNRAAFAVACCTGDRGRS